MEESTAEDWALIATEFRKYIRQLPRRIIDHLKLPARISPTPSAATRDKAVSTSLRSTTVLDVLFKYASARWPSRASYPRPSHAFRD